MPTQATAATLAKEIYGAIQSGAVIDPAPFLGLPLADGFAAQADVFRSLNGSLAGSKLTLKGDVCHSAPLITVSDSVRQPYQPGMSVEVEVALMLGADIAPGASRQDVVDAIASIRIGVELLRSRYEGGSRGDPALAAADLMSNLGYVLGPELDRTLLEPGAGIGTLLLTINGRAAYDKPAAHADGDLLKTVVALASQAPISPFSMLKAGQVITTGTLCGLVPVEAAGTVEVDMAGQRLVLNLI